MADALRTVTPRHTPQTEKAAAGQKKNHAGGYSFVVSPLERAKRFLILGSEGTFYQTGQKLSKENAEVIMKLAESDSTALVDLIVAVSLGGRAPKQNPALFALAIAASYGAPADRSYALQQLSKVARTGTHLFLFAGYVTQFRGWGRGLRRAIAGWYTERDLDKLAYQVVKYQNREGFTHGDLMSLSHPSLPHDDDFNGLARWVLRKDETKIPKLVKGFLKAQKPDADLPKLIRKYGLSWEMIPSEKLNDVAIWEALLESPKTLPLGALVRQLPRLTRIGVIKPLGGSTAAIVARLTDKEELTKARIHPLNVLVALKTYDSGRSERGSSTWQPVQKISDALDKAFYLAFDNVEPAGKRTLLAIDVSGSMNSQLGNVPLTAREASSALALVTAATEPETFIVGFTTGAGGSFGQRYYGYGHGKGADSVMPMNISPEMRLPDVLRYTNGLPFNRTDCSAPMQYAQREGLEVDTFIVYTDSETYAGTPHPHQALAEYRRATGIDAKLIVVGLTATSVTIADPNDAGMLDVVGFDTAVPQLITEFSKGL